MIWCVRVSYFKILQATSFGCSGKVPEKIVVASDDDDDDSDLAEVVSTNTQKDEKYIWFRIHWPHYFTN